MSQRWSKAYFQLPATGFASTDAISIRVADVHLRCSVLDPASPKRLERWDWLTFEHYWGSAGRIILPIFERPRGSAAPEDDIGARR